MANTKSAAKRARQMASRTLRNRRVLTRIRGMQKRTGLARPDATQIAAYISAIDKAAKRGIIHKNAAKRRKARLNKVLNANAAKPAAA